MCEKYQESYIPIYPNKLRDVFHISSLFTNFQNGAFSEFRKCSKYRDGSDFTMKIINTKLLNVNDLSVLETEINIMRELRHKNIMNLYDIFNTHYRSKIILILDVIQGPTLFDGILQSKASFYSEQIAIRIMAQICGAIEYLHSKSIIHGNIQPENIFYVSQDPAADYWKIKLIDFSTTAISKMTSSDPDTMYIAPETLSKAESTTKSDMYSIGVIMYILLCGYAPCINGAVDQRAMIGFIHEAQGYLSHAMPDEIISLCMQYFGSLFASSSWDNISEFAKDLIKQLLEIDPSKRPSASETLQDEWFELIDFDGYLQNKDLGSYFNIDLRRFQCIRKVRGGIKRIISMMRLIQALED